MTWAEWAELLPGSQAAVAAFSIQLNPPGNTGAQIFAALCSYGRTNFLYNPDTNGLTPALQSRMINCRSASDLMIGVYLHRNPTVNIAAQPFGVHGGNVPIVTPPIVQAGIRIQNNLRDGGGRMLFSDGHSIAAIGVDKFDLISGLTGQNIQNLFSQATAGTFVGGQPTLRCVINGVQRTFSRMPGTTVNGLSEFRVTPAFH